MSNLYSSLISLLGVTTLVFLHELGHYCAARWCGIWVEEFSVGFGPALWSWQNLERKTRYCLRILPLGGYVSIPDLVSDQNQLGPYKKIFISLAGPVANIVTASLLLFFCSWQVHCWRAEISPLTPDLAKVFSPGDRLISLNGEKTLSWSQSSAFLRSTDAERVEIVWQKSSGQMLRQTLSIERLRSTSGHLNLALNIPLRACKIDRNLGKACELLEPDESIAWLRDPLYNTLESLGCAAATAADGPSIQAGLVRAQQPSKIQVRTLQLDPTTKKLGLHFSCSQAFKQVELSRWQRLRIGCHFAGQRVQEAAWGTLAVLGSLARADFAQVEINSPIGIARIAIQTADRGWLHYLFFLASVSLGLAYMNLLPIPVTDGGIIVLAGAEILYGQALPHRLVEHLRSLGIVLLLTVASYAFWQDCLHFQLFQFRSKSH